MRRMTRTLSCALPCSLLLAASCVGQVSSEDSSIGRPGPEPATGVGGVAGPEVPAVCVATAAPGPSPLRRLTRFEYNNTVHELLGDDRALANRFPPEEGSLGFDNDANALRVSRLLAEEYLNAARDLAEKAVERMPALLGCDPGATATTEEACLRKFVAGFGARAFRRPLDADETTHMVTQYRSARADMDVRASFALVIQSFLIAPQFLYRPELSSPPGAVVKVAPFELASRLSYLFWGSMPDQEMFEAARMGKLTTAAEVRAQADRLLKDPRARPAVRHFHRLWLDLNAADGVQKDPMLFPGFTAEIGSLLRQETEAFIEDVLFAGDGKLQTLLEAPHTMLNAKLASFYGIKNGPTGTAFARVALDPKQRAGLITHASILSALATGNRTHPIQRGIFVRRQFLCSPPPDPPPGATAETPATRMLSPTATARERLAAHRANPACEACHRLIDPIGFALESYDAAGLYRNEENGKPIDLRGEILGTDAQGSVDGAVELAARLAKSEDVRQCVSLQWFRYAFGRSETESDACTREALASAFAASGGNVRELLLALTQTDAFLYRGAGAL